MPHAECPEVTAVASWFGSNRILAADVGARLRGCSIVGIPFAGGMAEVAEIDANIINVNDRHRHVINLARVMAHPVRGPKLYRQLRRIPFHPDALGEAQDRCKKIEANVSGQFLEGWRSTEVPDQYFIDWATEYFVCAWMSRHSTAGTNNEFDVGTSIRWKSGGGDSAKHYWSMVHSISAWRRILRRCNFTAFDFRVFLENFIERDAANLGIYCDPPFFGPGDKYKFPFTEQDHVDLRDLLVQFKLARVVIRYYDIPFVRRLYTEDRWQYIQLRGRKQTNDDAPEVLIVSQ